MPTSDLLLAPDFVLTHTPSYKTLVSKFENGAEQRRAKWSTSISKWSLSYSNRSQDDLNTIKTLFDARKGQATAFYWTNPINSTQYLVRFASDEISFSLKAYGIYDFSFDLQEVLA